MTRGVDKIIEPPVPGSPGAPATSFNTTSETEIAGELLCKPRAKSPTSRGYAEITRIRFRFIVPGPAVVAQRAAVSILQAAPGLKRRPAADRRGQRAFIEIIELAADRHAVGEPRHLDLGAVQEVGDVMGGALAVHGGVERQNDLLDGRVV